MGGRWYGGGHGRTGHPYLLAGVAMTTYPVGSGAIMTVVLFVTGLIVIAALIFAGVSVLVGAP